MPWKSLAQLAICTLLIGCSVPPPPHWRDGNYIVYTRPTSQEIIIGYHMGEEAILGLSDPTVTAAGSNSSYVVFRQETEDETAKFYFIKRESNREGMPSGPFTQEEFKSISVEKNLPEFSWNLKP